jgi:hypothetical protein
MRRSSRARVRSSNLVVANHRHLASQSSTFRRSTLLMVVYPARRCQDETTKPKHGCRRYLASSACSLRVARTRAPPSSSGCTHNAGRSLAAGTAFCLAGLDYVGERPGISSPDFAVPVLPRTGAVSFGTPHLMSHDGSARLSYFDTGHGVVRSCQRPQAD